MWYFKSFSPMLAVYDAGGWRTDVTAFPDQVFAESSFYVVDWTLPANLTLASSGTETGHDANGDQVTRHILAGPVREFAATAGARYAQVTQMAGDVTVRSTALLTDTAQAAQDRDIAAKSLATYNNLFGEYPFNELDLVLTPDGGGGIEFPGYVMISHLTPASRVRDHVVSHEVAHQWWYSLVGDDIFREPWLDESFADFSTYLYLQQNGGQAVADQVFAQQTAGQWPGWGGSAAAAGPTVGKRVGSAVWEFQDFNEYDGIIYGKGPVFLDRLRLLLGADRFERLLQTHYARNKYGVTSGRIFLSEALGVAGPDAPAVAALYLAWVEGR
jgi:aminopeptidase N